MQNPGEGLALRRLFESCSEGCGTPPSGKENLDCSERYTLGFCSSCVSRSESSVALSKRGIASGTTVRADRRNCDVRVHTAKSTNSLVRRHQPAPFVRHTPHAAHICSKTRCDDPPHSSRRSRWPRPSRTSKFEASIWAAGSSSSSGSSRRSSANGTPSTRRSRGTSGPTAPR